VNRRACISSNSSRQARLNSCKKSIVPMYAGIHGKLAIDQLVRCMMGDVLITNYGLVNRNAWVVQGRPRGPSSRLISDSETLVDLTAGDPRQK
jgi:hypothetical protein